jgi:protein-tyrosine-phosphatase
VSKKRQFVLMSAAAGGSAMPPMGSAKQVKDILSNYNTAPDGGPRKSLGTEMLHGPGMVLELPTSSDQITQIMASVTDEDIGIVVLMRLCKDQRWKVVDIETGRSFG